MHIEHSGKHKFSQPRLLRLLCVCSHKITNFCKAFKCQKPKQPVPYSTYTIFRVKCDAILMNDIVFVCYI